MSKKEKIELLVKEAQQNNINAFSSLIEMYQDELFKFCILLLGNVELAQDVCQETYIIALQKINKLKNPSAFKSWLFTVAKNIFYRV